MPTCLSSQNVIRSGNHRKGARGGDANYRIGVVTCCIQQRRMIGGGRWWSSILAGGIGRRWDLT
ncbi:MAG: hypothetical protein FWD57_16640 [Polyangiaceae bacterium]|nr:hypothetical protein [Polyangiaceae bacterium]